MKETNENPWREERVIKREGYQLRSNDEIRNEWRTVLIVSAIIVVLSAIATEQFGSAAIPERTVEIQSK